MTMNEPKDTRQRQSLTGAMSQQPDISGMQDLVQQQTGPQNPVQQALSQPAKSPFQSSVLERRRQRLQNAAPAQEPPDVTPEAGLTAPPSAPAPAPDQQGYGAPNMMVTTGVQTTSKTLPPEYEAAAKKAMEASAELETAQKNMIEAQQKDLTEAAKIKEAQATQEMTQAKLLQQRVEANIAAQQKAMARYQEDYNKYASQNIQNPWSRASTGSKVLAGLSIVLGGLSGPNGAESARKLIDDAIERDIELQKANLNKKKGDLTMLQQHAKDLQNMNISDINITKSMQALANGAVARQLEAMAATTRASNPAKADMMAQMANERRQAEFNLQQQVAKDTAATVTVRQEPMFSLMSGSEKKERAPTKLVENLAASEKGLKAAVKLKKMIEEKPELLDKIGVLAGPIAELKMKFVGDENAAKLSQAIKNEILNKLRAVTGAQMTDAERKYIAETMPSMFEAQETFLAKLDANIDSYKADYEDRYNLLEGQEYFMGGFERPSEILGWKPSSAIKKDK